MRHLRSSVVGFNVQLPRRRQREPDDAVSDIVIDWIAICNNVS